jgi:hypothetical protein
MTAEGGGEATENIHADSVAARRYHRSGAPAPSHYPACGKSLVGSDGCTDMGLRRRRGRPCCTA